MSKGVNKVILIGHLGADPDVRYTQTGSAVANISLATNYRIKNQVTDAWEDATEWHRVVFFERSAEVVEQYLRKGSQIYVEGYIRTEKWQDRDGQDRYTTKIYARDMQMLGSRADADLSQYVPPTRSSAPSPASPPPSNTPDEQPSAARSNKPSLPDDFEDDIPF